MVLSNTDGFFYNIRNQFGNKVTTLLKAWMNYTIRICKTRQQRIFLLRCRKYDVLPPHIQNIRCSIFFSSRSVNRRFDNYKQGYQKALLNLEIRDINNHLNFLRSEIRRIEDNLFTFLPEELVNNFFKINDKKISNVNLSLKTKSIEKFNRIAYKRMSENPFFNIDKTKWLVNLSKKSIPDHVEKILSLGDNFGLPIGNYKREDRLNTTLAIVKGFEAASHKIPLKHVNDVRGSITNSLLTFLEKDRHIDFMERHISREFRACKKFLIENDDVIVTKADKGQITVIMDKDDYFEKMTESLNDNLTYRILKKDPIKQLTTKINQLVKSWLDNGIIDESIYRRLRCTNGNLPRGYGLPKIHKVGFPFRIIVSTLGSPLYNVASFLHDVLYESISRPKSYVKDSWSLTNFLKNKKINDHELLISLDVTALFTNIPKELVMKAIENRWHEISKVTEFSLPQFLYAIGVVLDSTSFCFNGQIYEQIFGSPMGSPLSPILADIVMDDLETYCLSMLDFEIPVFYRYVDDIFAIVPTDKINDILKIFNSYHPRLNFTHEIETSGSIPFLDIMIIREGKNLLTNWYRKPTFSGRYINYFSSHPLKYKKNTIISLVDRAILLSDKRFHHSNIKIVKQILHNNCFPIEFINIHIKKRLAQLYNRREMENSIGNSVDARRFVSIPYIKGLSEDISRTLNTFGLTTVHSIPNKLNCVIRRQKDRLKKMDMTELVYKINCIDCDMVYIGQTKRHLETRIKEHQNDIKKNESNHSVVSKHRVTYGHNFDWSGTEILHKEKYINKREIAETFFIKKYDNTINLKKDKENLNAIYDKVISSI